MRNYVLSDLGLTDEARRKLPDVLKEMGYEGKYSFNQEQNILSMNTTPRKIAEVFHRAEAAAHGEDGYLVKIAQTSYSTMWVPKSEAATLRDAYLKVVDAVDNGWSVDQDPELFVGSAEDGDRMRGQWEVERM